jgi:5-methylcytosine-specific restriction enzyme subunit McrC
MTIQRVCLEYSSFPISNRNQLESYLIQVWRDRFYVSEEMEPLAVSPKKYQGFISFDGNIATAKNYVGIIQTENQQIEIYPKVFGSVELSSPNTIMFIKHIFFWFDYCRKWKFPFTNNNLDQSLEYDLPEMIINIMGSRILEVISSSPISLYEETEESLSMPRGRINFSRYLSMGLSSGNYHIVECDLEPLQYDNKLNKALKYVTRLLHHKARFNETRNKLNEILYILDEVEDTPFSSIQLNQIKINSFYSDYVELIDICRLVLDQQLYNNQHYEQNHWCLLFPMEYVFEDFVAGFIETYFNKEWVVSYQKSDKYLTDEGVFQMQHDILMTHRKIVNLTVIVDTKYKLRTPDLRGSDGKKGISQNDLYQMTSYAFRRGCNTVLMLYPNCAEGLQDDDYFTVSSGFMGKDKIHVFAAEIPFWSMLHFDLLAESLEKKINAVLDIIKLPRK